MQCCATENDSDCNRTEGTKCAHGRTVLERLIPALITWNTGDCRENTRHKRVLIVSKIVIIRFAAMNVCRVKAEMFAETREELRVRCPSALC